METVWVADLGFETDRRPNNDVLLEMAAGLENREDWSLSALGRGDGVRVLVYLDSSTGGCAAPLHAVTDLGEAVVEWVVRWLPDAKLTSVRLVTEQQLELEALAPPIPQLASASDVAELLGVSRQRVWQLVKNHVEFPAPIARVASGPLWTRDAIEWFGSVWTRKAGRPRTAKPGALDKGAVTVPSGSAAIDRTARTG